MSQENLHAGLQCPNCKEIIVSQYRHDFLTCSCGCLSIDGGPDYLRILWKKDIKRKDIKHFKIRLTNLLRDKSE